MTDPREQLAKLTPHAAQIGLPFGGRPAVTPEDVAASLAFGHLTPMQSSLLLAKYCDDGGALDQARWLFTDIVVTHAVEQRWRAQRGKARLLKMATITLYEHIATGACVVCDGVGTLVVESAVRQCRACHGAGRRFKSERALANLLDMASHKTFQTIWRPRFAWCRSELATVD